METFIKILAIVAPTFGAIIIELLKSRKLSKETLKVVTAMSEDMPAIKSELKLMKSASRTGLQTQILEKCKRIQIAVKDDEIDYEEELKQLIILYKEYYSCGFNSQGRLYFNDTIKLVAEHDNVLVRNYMNMLFPEYDPDEDAKTHNKE